MGWAYLCADVFDVVSVCWDDGLEAAPLRRLDDPGLVVYCHRRRERHSRAGSRVVHKLCRDGVAGADRWICQYCTGFSNRPQAGTQFYDVPGRRCAEVCPTGRGENLEGSTYLSALGKNEVAFLTMPLSMVAVTMYSTFALKPGRPLMWTSWLGGRGYTANTMKSRTP